MGCTRWLTISSFPKRQKRGRKGAEGCGNHHHKQIECLLSLRVIPDNVVIRRRNLIIPAILISKANCPNQTPNYDRSLPQAICIDQTEYWACQIITSNSPHFRLQKQTMKNKALWHIIMTLAKIKIYIAQVLFRELSNSNNFNSSGCPNASTVNIRDSAYDLANSDHLIHHYVWRPDCGTRIPDGGYVDAYGAHELRWTAPYSCRTCKSDGPPAYAASEFEDPVRSWSIYCTLGA